MPRPPSCRANRNYLNPALARYGSRRPKSSLVASLEKLRPSCPLASKILEAANCGEVSPRRSQAGRTPSSLAGADYVALTGRGGDPNVAARGANARGRTVPGQCAPSEDDGIQALAG